MNIKRWNIALRFIGLAIFLIILFKVDWKKIFHLFQSLDLLILPPVFCLCFLAVVIKAWRWRYLVSLKCVYLPWWSAFLVQFDAIYISLVTPARVGEAIKAVYLKKVWDVPYSTGLANVIVDRALDLLVLISITFFGSCIIFFKQGYLFLIWFAPIFLFIFYLLFKDRIRKFADNLAIKVDQGKIRSKFLNIMLKFPEELIFYLQGKIWWAIFLAFLSYLVIYTAAYLVVISLKLPLSFLFLVYAISFANLIGNLPISIGGLGTKEATFIWLFSLKSISPEQSVGYSLLLLTFSFLLLWLVGFIVWNISPLDLDFKE